MIWRYESEIDVGRAVVHVGWDAVGEEYRGCEMEPPSWIEPDWEQLGPDIDLDRRERETIRRELANQIRGMRMEVDGD